MDKERIVELVEYALAAKERAYAPYSGFRVGAAIAGKSGRIYLGCNIENASYTPTSCAERTALFKAVSEGERSFSAIAIISDGRNPTPPCGVCRQVLAEFCDADMPIICADRNREYVVVTLAELLPMAFTKKDLE